LQENKAVFTEGSAAKCCKEDIKFVEENAFGERITELDE